jgi:hypothetical protein
MCTGYSSQKSWGLTLANEAERQVEMGLAASNFHPWEGHKKTSNA